MHSHRPCCQLGAVRFLFRHRFIAQNYFMTTTARGEGPPWQVGWIAVYIFLDTHITSRIVIIDKVFHFVLGSDNECNNCCRSIARISSRRCEMFHVNLFACWVVFARTILETASPPTCRREAIRVEVFQTHRGTDPLSGRLCGSLGIGAKHRKNSQASYENET
jgi:hypothetical protein